MAKPTIFITNDDGFRSKGISSLIEAAREFANLIVVAPNNSKSGQSQALTVKEIIRVNKMVEEDGLTIYRSSGTPTDCVKFAIRELGLKPDLILSGINHGINSSISVHYSGTLGAAKEGTLMGYPSVAFSLDNFGADPDFSNAKDVIKKVVPMVLEKGLPEGICLNINVPDVKELKGIKVCRQAKGRWVEKFEKHKDPHGQDYYWLTGHYELLEPESQDTDEWFLRAGYASIVPTNIDTTAYKMLDEVESWGL